MVSRRIVSSIVFVGMVISGCASARFGMTQEKILVEQAIPSLLDAWVPKAGVKHAGDVISGNLGGTQLRSWYIEELKGNASYQKYEERYLKKKYLADVSPKRLKEEEADWDFSTFSMMDKWLSWTTLFWECFLESKQEFERHAESHNFRIVSPDLERIYDVVIIRSRNPGSHLVAESITGRGAEKLWDAINPVRSDEFPRSSVFGPTRFVEPIAAERSNFGHYSVMQSYARRYFASGTFLNAEYGKRRGRDTYILVLLSEDEFIVLQTVIYEKTTHENLISDLSAIVGIDRTLH